MAELAYSKVPKDLGENLAFRRWVLEQAKSSRDFREDFFCLCSRDLLFFVNACCWTNNPREVDWIHVPFITWPAQDRLLLTCAESWGRFDLKVEKSRETGVSWCMTTCGVWQCRFHRDQSFLVASRNQTYVDQTGNPKCLFWKMDYIERFLPWFMKVPMERNVNRLAYPGTGSVVNGESTTGKLARGDRRTCIMLDEFQEFDVRDGYDALGSTQHATNCRWFNGTPAGTGNAFYDVHKMDRIRKVRLHWSDWPRKAAGLYTATDGRLKVLDEGYVFPDGYEFVLDGKVRSPYYDEQCSRTPIASMIAQELDIDFLGSGSPLLTAQETARLASEFVKEPLALGEVGEDDRRKVVFGRSAKGKLRLWFNPDVWGDTPRDRQYVIGVDIALGTGSSTSAACVGDCRTGEKVAEYASAFVRPDELADVVLTLAKWFSDGSGRPAYVIWEANGPGRNFGDRLLKLGFSNVYWRRNEEKLLGSKPTDVPGWWATPSNKKAALIEYTRACLSGDFVERSLETVEELKLYGWGEDGVPVHSGSSSAVDPSGAKDNHGDRVIASALCWKGMCELVRPEERGVDEFDLSRPPVGTADWMAMQWHEEQRRRRIGVGGEEYWMQGVA